MSERGSNAAVAVELEYLKEALIDQRKNLRALTDTVTEKFDKQSELYEKQAKVSMEFRHATTLELNKIQTRLGIIITGAIIILNYGLPYVLKLLGK